MAEWSIAAVLKTVEVRASGGSNPSLSAEQPCNFFDLQGCLSFCVFRYSAGGIFLFYVIIFQGAADENACI